MTKGLALITGANGFIAGRTVETFLKAGWAVRGTVRSLKSAGPLQEALASYGSRFELVEVPDITIPGAFDAALDGVTAVAHLASPVSLQFTDPGPVIRAAVDGTVGILASAAHVQSVKSFVLLSSVAAMSHRTDEPITLTEADWNDWAEPLVLKLGDGAPGGAIYSYSKLASEQAFWRFRDSFEGKLPFAMTAVNPSFVAGPPITRLQSPEQVPETDRFIWDVLRGGDLATAGIAGLGVPGSSGYVDVRDVARVVLFAAEHPAETDGERYLTSAWFAGAQAVADILRREYPDRRDVIQEGSPGEEYFPGYRFGGRLVHNSSKVLRTTGQDFLPFETTVLDTVKVLEHLL